ncbi:uncharacterized protein [Lolium perenne]|uniref:uncharacterized protein n=1 Tax=Lolium perenne TaxID=4522 RepID=UPI003A9902B1
MVLRTMLVPGFLDEISDKIARAAEDKSNDNLNWTLIDLFNNNISSWALREIPRTGARFTWSNHQLNPVRSALDRVFVSATFEAIFPLCSLSAETSLGSDHMPLVFYIGEGFPVRTNIFFFETSWFKRQDFVPLVQHSWERLLTKVGGRDIIDWWTFMSSGLRQFLRGWNQNLGRDTKAEKSAMLTQIAQLDVLADATGLDEDAWASRYHLEEQLLHIYRMGEEEHWRKRGRVRVCGLAPSSWGEEARVSKEENVGLACTFSEAELEAIVKDMKTDTAPGPDGFPVTFFKRFWPQVKHGILLILNDFVLGRIDIARLNFRILSLIPKVPGAEQI